MAYTTWHQRILAGEIKVCPACGSLLDHEELKEFNIIACSNETCVWTDEKADFVDMGHWTPPPGWKLNAPKN